MLLVIILTVMALTNEFVVTADQCEEYHFQSPFFPGESCEEIYNENLESHDKPGYYWILNGPRKVYCGMNYTGSSCENIYISNPETGDKSGYYRIDGKGWTYCSMAAIMTCIHMADGVAGEGWRRIAHFDISAGDPCPSGWRRDTTSTVSYCRVINDTGHNVCSSTSFSTSGESYQKVCGKARGYQQGWVHSFLSYHHDSQVVDINDAYLDGLSITYGHPHQHIWSYVAGRFDNHTSIANCPCAIGGGLSAPPFVETNYYCESGNSDVDSYTEYFLDDPLWDRSGCITSTCCSNPVQPWFYYELSETSSSEIEARICTFLVDTRNVFIDQLDLYIQ